MTRYILWWDSLPSPQSRQTRGRLVSEFRISLKQKFHELARVSRDLEPYKRLTRVLIKSNVETVCGNVNFSDFTHRPPVRTGTEPSAPFIPRISSTGPPVARGGPVPSVPSRTDTGHTDVMSTHTDKDACDPPRADRYRPVLSVYPSHQLQGTPGRVSTAGTDPQGYRTHRRDVYPHG